MEQTRNCPQSYEKNNIIVDPRGKTKEGGGGGGLKKPWQKLRSQTNVSFSLFKTLSSYVSNTLENISSDLTTFKLHNAQLC